MYHGQTKRYIETIHATSILKDISIDTQSRNISTMDKPTKQQPQPSDLINLQHLANQYEKQQIKLLLNQFSDVFSLDPNDIGHCTVLPQRIVLKDNTKVANTPPYRIAPNLQGVVVQYVDKLFQAGVIQKSTSPFCSPLLLVKKAG